MVSRERFGSYEVHERLGAGGMATVHRATIALAGGGARDVALKRMLPQLADERQFVDDFVREAKLAARLTHPNIVRILELGRIDKTYFIAMELVRGHPLMALMRKAFIAKKKVPIGVVLWLGGELCDALDYAYGEATGDDGQLLRVVHRDLSPSNLLVTDDGHIKIIDFGVAKALAGQFITNTGMVKGKLGYMSSEALAGKIVDGRSDLFSVGAIVWELLACRRLFKGQNDYDVIAKIRAGKVEPPSKHNPKCPSELDDVVVRALALDPERRWESAAAMRRALDGVRRYYSRQTTAREVVKWKRALGVEEIGAPSVVGEGSKVDRPDSPPYAELSIRRRPSEPSVQVRERAVRFEPKDYDEPSERASSDTLRDGKT